MPTSYHHQITKITNLIIILDPKSILDIGVGFGKYGVLCREYLELWDGRGEYNKFLRRIDGIEAFKKYITPLHNYIYNHIYIGNAFDLVDKLKFKYDLVLLIDVLEHFAKQEGKSLINKLSKKHKGILISIPKNVTKQKDAFNNKYEIHKAQWSKQELSKLGSSFFIYDSSKFVLYIGKKEMIKELKKEYSITRKLKRFSKKFPLVKSIYYKIKNNGSSG